MIFGSGDPQDSAAPDIPARANDEGVKGATPLCPSLAETSPLERRVFGVLGHLLPAVRKMQLDQLRAVRSLPSVILDLGLIPEAEGGIDALFRTYPKAQLIVADISSAAALSAPLGPPRASFSNPSLRVLAAQPERLPVAEAVADLLLATLSLPEPASPEILRECRRTLRPGGLMMLAALGAASLDLLARLASQPVDPAAGSTPTAQKEAMQRERELHKRLHDLHIAVEMQRLGDALFEAGFTDVVADVERIALGPEDLSTLRRIMQSPPDGEEDPSMPQEGIEDAAKIADDAVMEILFVHALSPRARAPEGGERRGVVFPEFR